MKRKNIYTEEEETHRATQRREVVTIKITLSFFSVLSVLIGLAPSSPLSGCAEHTASRGRRCYYLALAHRSQPARLRLLRFAPTLEGSALSAETAHRGQVRSLPPRRYRQTPRMYRPMHRWDLATRTPSTDQGCRCR